MLTKKIPQDGLLINKFLLFLKEKQFIGNKFLAGIPILDIKYNHLGLKYKNSFNSFKNQLDYALAYYFAELKTTKGNINKFLSDSLMSSFPKKLSYKNLDEQIKKLLEISQSIPENKWIKHKFDLENGVSGITRQKIAIQLQNVVNCIRF